ncbi:hypothetical protein COLO4_16130 [Corchorus olitorius]|uniref:Uncharacterized protein n=1 Tax=Corchorus olitorius TaxID=93759 RepID=A0A1R3JJF9_9ROSI|nr:hypothetical protein COLO4_16130 [Corchorus olitorius]
MGLNRVESGSSCIHRVRSWFSAASSLAKRDRRPNSLSPLHRETNTTTVNATPFSFLSSSLQRPNPPFLKLQRHH